MACSRHLVAPACTRGKSGCGHVCKAHGTHNLEPGEGGWGKEHTFIKGKKNDEDYSYDLLKLCSLLENGNERRRYLYIKKCSQPFRVCWAPLKLCYNKSDFIQLAAVHILHVAQETAIQPPRPTTYNGKFKFFGWKITKKAFQRQELFCWSVIKES